MEKHNFKELLVWQKAIDLCVKIYRETESFPRSEQYGLTNQIRRSAVSIPSNIAEGAGRRTNPQFVNFLNISNGSSTELETQLIIGNKLEFLGNDPYDGLITDINEIQRMNYKLVQTLLK